MKKKHFILILFLIITSILIIQSLSYAWRLRLLGSISETYDDNIRSTSENIEQDYITDLILGVGLRNEGRTHTIDFIGHVYQQLFYDHNELSNNAQDFILNYVNQLTSTDTFTLNNTFNHYPELRNFDLMLGQHEGRYSYYMNTLTLRYFKYFVSDFSTDIHYTNTYVKALSEGIYDSVSHSPGISFNYSINTFNIISLFYDYRFTKFDTDEGQYRNGRNEIIQHDAGIGYQHFFTRQLNINLRGGIEYIEVQDEKNYNPFMTATLVNDIDANNNITIIVSKRYGINSLTNEAYNTWTYSVNFIRQLSAILNFSFAGFYQYGDLISPTIETKNKLLGITTYLRYFFSESNYIGATYIYTYNKIDQKAPESSSTEYDRNQIRFAINAEI